MIGAKAMTGHELKAIRQTLGLTLSGFGKALGYQGSKNTLSVIVRRFESGARAIPEKRAAKAIELSSGGAINELTDRPMRDEFAEYLDDMKAIAEIRNQNKENGTC